MILGRPVTPVVEVVAQTGLEGVFERRGQELGDPV